MSSFCDVNTLVTTGLAVVAAGVLVVTLQHHKLRRKNKIYKKKKNGSNKKNFTLSRTSSQSDSCRSANIQRQDLHDSVMEVSPGIDSKISYQVPHNNSNDDDDETKQSTKTEFNTSSLHQVHQLSKIKKAEEYYADDKLANAATILQSIESEMLEQKHKEMISRAKEAQTLVDDLRSIMICHDEVLEDDGNSAKWVDQGIHKGETPTRILHKLDMEKLDKAGDPQLTVVCESPIEKDLLMPLLFVLNESELVSNNSLLQSD